MDDYEANLGEMGKHRVILVHPETEDRETIVNYIIEAGFDCIVISTLSELSDLIERENFDVILSEILLPDGAGLRIFELLVEADKNIPVVFISGKSSMGDIKQAFKLGANDYLMKPVEPKELIDALKESIRTFANYSGPERRGYPSITPEPLYPALRDELTGLASHRYVMEKLVGLYKRCLREATPLTLCVIDIDGFRKFNNEFGFDAGDLLLIEVSRGIKRMVRQDDIIGRYGNDEFLLILPGADKEATYNLVGRIMDKFKDSPPLILGHQADIALCAGIAEIETYEPTEAYEFLDRAIEALYHARLRGPWSTVVWTPGLSRETYLYESDETDPLMPDYESINIMMWRFRELNKKLTTMTLEALRVLVAAVEARDPYTKHHSVRVAAFSRYIAEELKLDKNHIQVVHSAALLHDIGKIGITDKILTKPGKLTPAELELIRQHPVIGVNILEQTSFFTAELPLIKHHHEWYDGRGYPDGLMGEDIPLGSRIINVADATEAMFARRSYKDNYDVEFVLHQLEEGKGKQFDPKIADLAISLISDGILQKIWSRDLYNLHIEKLAPAI